MINGLCTEQELMLLALIAGVLLIAGIFISLLNSYYTGRTSSVELRLMNVLPGMNCGQCGYPGCQAFARALIAGRAETSLCRPGGPEMAADLATVLGKPQLLGESYDEVLFAPRLVAHIHPTVCNGCAKCKKGCRVDAIDGLIKQPHQVRVKDCIGCGECVDTCPEGAIEMQREKQNIRQFDWKINSVRVFEANK